MSKSKLLWVVVPAVVLIGVGAASAEYKHYRGHHHDPGRMVEHISQSLDLTAEQRQKLDAVKDALVQGRKDMRRQRVDAINQVIEEVRKPEMDQERLKALVEQRMASMDTMLPRLLGPVIEFHKSLDEEQRDKIVNLLETFRDWGHGRFGRG